MKSILFEGTELSGKTSLVEGVSEKLGQMGYKTLINTGPIDKESDAVKFLLSNSDNIKNRYLKESFYTLALINDSSPKDLPRYKGIDYFLQDRNFASVIAFSKVFNKYGINYLTGTTLTKAYPKFDINIMVTVNQEERIRRLQKRERQTNLDQLVIADPQKILLLEEEMRLVLKNQPNFIEIDTTNIDFNSLYENLARRILE
jgi:thymidylate kinase